MTISPAPFILKAKQAVKRGRRMESGRKGLTVKWLAGICGMLFIGGGNMIGAMAQGMAFECGAALESQMTVRLLATGGTWAVGLILTAVIYALGGAMQKIDRLELWIMNLDTAVRNQKSE